MASGGERPDWDEYMMLVAELAAVRSTCLRRRVGCVLSKHHHILSTGYNGAPSGAPHCREIGCIREERGVPSGERAELCRAAHAEMNAVAQAARYGTPLEGATAYVTCQPCAMCLKVLVQSGVERIVWKDGYADRLALALAEECGWTVERNEMTKAGGV